MSPCGPSRWGLMADGRCEGGLSYVSAQALEWERQPHPTTETPPSITGRSPPCSPPRMPAQVQFSPDGRWLVSASFDKAIKLWDGLKGTFVATFRGHVGPVYQVAWSADSRLFVSGSKDSTLKVRIASPRVPVTLLYLLGTGAMRIAESSSGQRFCPELSRRLTVLHVWERLASFACMGTFGRPSAPI